MATVTKGLVFTIWQQLASQYDVRLLSTTYQLRVQSVGQPPGQP